MATFPIISSDIQEKLKLFREQEETISSIETQLASLKQQHEALQEELAPYLRSDTVPHSDTYQNNSSPHSTILNTDVPVHQFPDEILQMVFKEYLSLDHIRIKTLLLVCKRWKQIVMDSPMLWAQIQITYSADLLDFVAKKSLVPYVDACMERSGGLPLHVELNLFDLPTTPEYLRYEVIALLEALVDENQQNGIPDCFDETEFQLESTLCDQKIKLALEGIFGLDNKYLSRWATLSLKLPEYLYFTNEIWERFTVPFLQLSEFDVKYVPIHWRQELRLNLRSVERLKIWEAAPLSLFDIEPKKLTHLDIGFDKNLFNLEGLSSLINLRALTLTFRKELPHILPLQGEAPISIYLPRLKAITLVGDSTPLSAINFELPALTTLTLEAKSEFITPPRLSAKHIRWYIGIKSPKNQWRSEEAVDILLSLSSITQSVTVQEFARLGLLKAVAKHLENGTAPVLEQLFVEHENGWLEKMAARDAPQLLTMIPSENSDA